MQRKDDLTVWLTTGVKIIGGLTACLALLVLIGWHTHSTVLIQLNRSFAPMQYNTALCLLACGLGLICMASGRSRWAVACALAPVTFGLLTLVEYVSGIDLGIDRLFFRAYAITVHAPQPGRMSPLSASCFLLTGVALLLLAGRAPWRARFSLAGMMGGAVAAIGGATFLCHLTGIPIAYGWSPFTQMAVHTAFGFLAAGLGALILAWRESRARSFGATRWFAAIVPVGVVIATLILWQALLAQERVTMLRAIDAAAARMRDAVGERLQADTRALARMGRRWEVAGKPPRAYWEADARQYVRDSPEYQAVEWIDPSLHIRWVVPLKGNEAALNINLMTGKRRTTAVLAARDRKIVTLSRPIHLVQGGAGFLLDIPLVHAGRFEGLIAGVFRIDRFLAAMPREAVNGYSVAVSEGGEEVYYEGDPRRAREDEWGRETRVDLAGVAWTLRVTPDADMLARYRSPLPPVVLAAGLLTALLVGGLIFSMQRAQVARRHLEAEIGRRIAAEEASREQQARVESFYWTSHWLMTCENLSDVLRAVADGLAETLPADRTSLILFDLDAHAVTHFVKGGQGIGDVVTVPFEELQEGLSGWVLRERQPALSPKGAPDPRESPAAQRRRAETECGAIMVAPLLYHGHLLGTVTAINRPDEPDFAAQDMELLMAMANVAATAIENFRLVRLLREAHDELERRVRERTEALRDSEERFRATFEQAAVGIAHVRADGQWLQVNQKLCDIVGYSREELLACTFQDITHPDDLDADLAYVRQMLAGEIPTYSMEKRYYRKDGSVIWINLTVALVREPSGEPKYFISVVEDITERKQMEEALRESEERYRFLADAMPQIVWTARPDGNLDYYNKRWYDYTGMDFEQTKDWGWQPVLHPDDLQNCIDRWTRAFTTGEAYEVEYRFKRSADGEYRWHLGRAWPRWNADGELVQWVGTCTDIDDFKRAQAALLQMNEALEERVNARTAELARSNADLQQFAYVASHDLQEPLRAIASFVQLLEKRYKGQLDEQADRWIGHIVGGATRLQTLINDLLAYSRVGTHGKQLQPTDTKEVVATALENLEVSVVENSAQITCGYLPTVFGDAVQLVSLFQNLIGNALKYRSEQPPRIHVEARREAAEWLFSVCDNGIGIDPQFYERIFVLFQRLHSRKTISGTGIGLALCKRIVERHGGRIWVESEPGSGATFGFTLPAIVMGGRLEGSQLALSRERDSMYLQADSLAHVTGLQG